MTEQHLKYARKFPQEVRLAIEGLSGQNELGYAIMMLLVEEGSVQFKQIKNELDVHPQSLTNAIGDLEKGGLVEKRAGDQIGSQTTGEYVITNFGDRVLDSLYKASQPEVEIETERSLSKVLENLPQEQIEESIVTTGLSSSELFNILSTAFKEKEKEGELQYISDSIINAVETAESFRSARESTGFIQEKPDDEQIEELTAQENPDSTQVSKIAAQEGSNSSQAADTELHLKPGGV
jgi:DNA-binding HxlR family transcriptional regulator